MVHGHIAEAALREKSEGPLVIYATAVTMKRSPGANDIPVRDIIARLRELDMFSSAAYVLALLKRGRGVFWQMKSGKIWLLGASVVAQRLGATGTSWHRQIISTRDLRTRGDRRAALLAAALPDGKPIRQLTVRKITSVTERTQRRYRGRGHFRAERQDADLTAASQLPTVWMRKQWAAANKEYGVYVLAGGKKLMKRIANRYVPSGPRLRAGRRSREMFAARPLNFATGASTVPRTFFKTDVAWTRCRKLKMGTPGAELYAAPYNVSYVQRDESLWEAVAC